MDRIKAVDGNMSELSLGITDPMQQDLFQNVQIILHTAADVRFDESLKNLLLVNLRGTREVFRLAEKMTRLELVLHISTAYSHCPRTQIEEKFYAPPIDPHKMISFAERFSANKISNLEMEILTEKIIDPWPNTYTFSKALSEELVRKFSENFPVAIIRPTIGMTI